MNFADINEKCRAKNYVTFDELSDIAATECGISKSEALQKLCLILLRTALTVDDISPAPTENAKIAKTIIHTPIYLDGRSTDDQLFYPVPPTEILSVDMNSTLGRPECIRPRPKSSHPFTKQDWHNYFFPLHFQYEEKWPKGKTLLSQLDDEFGIEGFIEEFCKIDPHSWHPSFAAQIQLYCVHGSCEGAYLEFLQPKGARRAGRKAGKITSLQTLAGLFIAQHVLEKNKSAAASLLSFSNFCWDQSQALFVKPGLITDKNQMVTCESFYSHLRTKSRAMPLITAQEIVRLQDTIAHSATLDDIHKSIPPY